MAEQTCGILVTVCCDVAAGFCLDFLSLRMPKRFLVIQNLSETPQDTDVQRIYAEADVVMTIQVKVTILQSVNP